MSSFHGPGPFDGDAISHHLGPDLHVPHALRAAVVAAFAEVRSGGAASRIPPALLEMLGLPAERAPAAYVDVDDAVWAWACAEFLALALGHPAESPVPARLAAAARAMPDPEALIPEATAALEVIARPGRSELASLAEEAGSREVLQRIAGLRDRLSSVS